MKKIAYPIISLFVLLLVVNCPAPFNTIDMPGSGSMQMLPRDEVLSFRGSDGSAGYELYRYDVEQ